MWGLKNTVDIVTKGDFHVFTGGSLKLKYPEIHAMTIVFFTFEIILFYHAICRKNFLQTL